MPHSEILRQIPSKAHRARIRRRDITCISLMLVAFTVNMAWLLPSVAERQALAELSAQDRTVVTALNAGGAGCR